MYPTFIPRCHAVTSHQRVHADFLISSACSVLSQKWFTLDLYQTYWVRKSTLNFILRTWPSPLSWNDIITLVWLKGAEIFIIWWMQGIYWSLVLWSDMPWVKFWANRPSTRGISMYLHYRSIIKYVFVHPFRPLGDCYLKKQAAGGKLWSNLAVPLAQQSFLKLLPQELQLHIVSHCTFSEPTKVRKADHLQCRWWGGCTVPGWYVTEKWKMLFKLKSISAWKLIEFSLFLWQLWSFHNMTFDGAFQRQ